MFKKEVVFCIFYLSTIFNISVGQNPLHYFIGESELAGIDVYDLLYGKNKILYVASSNGVYAIENENIIHYINDVNQKGTSVFSLTENSSGDIYCINLRGQLFHLNNDSLKLIHTFASKSLGHAVQINSLNRDEILFSSSQLIKYNIKSKAEERVTYKNTIITHTNLYQTITKKREIAVPFVYNEEIVTAFIDSNTIRFSRLDNYKVNKRELVIPKYLQIGDSSFILTRKNEIVDLENGGIINKINYSYYFLSSENGKSLYNDFVNGIFLVESFKGQTKKNLIFTQTPISCSHFSDEKTRFLGTFGKGIIVIPNINIQSITPINFNEDIGGFDIVKDYLFVSTLQGSIYGYNNNQIDTILFKSNNRIDHISVLPINEIDSYQDAKKCLSYMLKNDKRFINKTAYIQQSVKRDGVIDLASYMGLTVYSKKRISSPQLSFHEIEEIEKKFIQPYMFAYLHKDSRLGKRGRAIAQIGETNNLIYANDQGLFKLNEAYEVFPLYYKNKNLDVFCLKSLADSVLIGTSNGMFCFVNDSIFELDKINKQLGSRKVRGMVVKSQNLFILENNQIKRFNIHTHKLQSTYLEGITGQKIQNIQKFSVKNDSVFFLYDNNIYSFNWKKHQPRAYNFKLYIDSVKLGKESFAIREKMRTSFSNNYLRIPIKFYDLLHHPQVVIRYRIKNLDNDWNVLSNSKENIYYNYLPYGNHTFEIILSYNNQIEDEFSFNFKIKKPYYLQGWFISLLLFIIIFILYLIYKRRVKKLKAKSEKDLNEKQLLLDSIDAQLKTIRAQMNPHFIFNSLNAIQSLVLNQQTEKSYDYLVVFSNLVRKTLVYSEQEFISISDEMEFLNLYLKIEALRLGDDFEYEIENKLKEEFSIPSLLIQPFIENAIIHGLIHKRGKKKIQVTFQAIDNPIMITCLIKDNGIGRDASKKINSSRENHQSFSLEAIQKRLDMLNKKYHSFASYKIKDLTENGHSSGTEIELNIPIEEF